MRLRVIFAVVAIVVLAAWVYHRTQPATSQATTEVPKSSSIFNKSQHSLTDPMSIWVVVNKHRPLQPSNYAPSDLVVPPLAMRVSGTKIRKVVEPAMAAMFTAAKANGTPLRISSGYRSYAYQVGLYNGYVQSQGKATADAESARPGYSEHQTGLAADVDPLDGQCSVQQCFATTPAGKWLAANAYKYGFIVRYPQGLTAVTGYEYEPWHIRYVGVDLATEMHKQNVQTLEQFFDLGAAPTY